MPTATTVLAVEDAILAGLNAHATITAAGITATSAWQPWKTPEQVFIGSVDGESEIPTLKAGRKQRTEDYSVEVVLRSGQPGGSASEVRAVKQTCLGYYAALDDILADDPTLGVDVLWMVLDSFEMRTQPVPDFSGWGCEIIATVTVSARLT